MTPEATLTAWADVPPEPMNALLTRQFITGSQAMISRIVLKKGAIVPKHAHPNEQIAFVTEGKMKFVLGDSPETVEKIVRANEVLVIPGNLPHSAEALEDTINFDLFAPPRQDWIDRDDSYLR